MNEQEAIERVRDLHKRKHYECSPDECAACEVPYPCQTIRALTGEFEK